MPTWSVECTDACSVTGKPESNICTYRADPLLDISRVLMSRGVERLIDCTSSVERLLVVSALINQAGSLNVLLRADATATTTTTHSSPRQPALPGHASVRDRIDRAKGMTVCQAIRLNFYTTRSLKRDETAGYIRLVRATGEVIRIPACATQRAMESKAIEVQWSRTLT
jgi:hypothetical protein